MRQLRSVLFSLVLLLSLFPVGSQDAVIITGEGEIIDIFIMPSGLIELVPEDGTESMILFPTEYFSDSLILDKEIIWLDSLGL